MLQKIGHGFQVKFCSRRLFNVFDVFCNSTTPDLKKQLREHFQFQGFEENVKFVFVYFKVCLF